MKKKILCISIISVLLFIAFSPIPAISKEAESEKQCIKLNYQSLSISNPEDFTVTIERVGPYEVEFPEDEDKIKLSFIITVSWPDGPAFERRTNDDYGLSEVFNYKFKVDWGDKSKTYNCDEKIGEDVEYLVNLTFTDPGTYDIIATGIYCDFVIGEINDNPWMQYWKTEVNTTTPVPAVTSVYLSGYRLYLKSEVVAPNLGDNDYVNFLKKGMSYDFIFKGSHDIVGDSDNVVLPDVKYVIDWGDGSDIYESEYLLSGSELSLSHTYDKDVEELRTRFNLNFKVIDQDDNEIDADLYIIYFYDISAEISGGNGFSMKISNNGDEDIKDMPYEIRVYEARRGFLLFDLEKEGYIDIPAKGTATIKSGLLLGFGRIQISLIVSDPLIIQEHRFANLALFYVSDVQ